MALKTVTIDMGDAVEEVASLVCDISSDQRIELPLDDVIKALRIIKKVPFVPPTRDGMRGLMRTFHPVSINADVDILYDSDEYDCECVDVNMILCLVNTKLRLYLVFDIDYYEYEYDEDGYVENRGAWDMHDEISFDITDAAIEAVGAASILNIPSIVFRSVIKLHDNKTETSKTEEVLG